MPFKDTQPTGRVFRMKPLPKPEYQLMKDMIDIYGITDPCELFTVLLRLSYEVVKYDSGKGEQWFVRAVNDIRKTDASERVYYLEE